MTSPKQTVLITGCSGGGMGYELAIAFHNAGYYVYATARNPDKMAQLAKLGIDTRQLDVLSSKSIASCLAEIPALDILVNNAGGQFMMPVVDVDIEEAKKTFNLNFWSYIEVTQAFLPLLLQSKKAMIVNQTSIAATSPVPWQAIYNSSKAAMAMVTENMRLELHPFNIKVVDLRTGLVLTNFVQNVKDHGNKTIPAGSIYEPARDVLEEQLGQKNFEGEGIPAKQWAEDTVRDLIRGPPLVIWRGASARLARFAAIMPTGMFDSTLAKMGGLDKVQKMVQPRKE